MNDIPLPAPESGFGSGDLFEPSLSANDILDSGAHDGFDPPAVSADLPTWEPEKGSSAQELTKALIDEMPSQRRTLLEILEFCRTQQPVEEVDARVACMQAGNKSVFTSAVLCSLLKRSGALERVTETGLPFEEADTEPEVVVVDGVECLKPRATPALYWVSTEAGVHALEAEDLAAELRSLFAEEAAYLPIYKHVLALGADHPAQTDELRVDLDAQPLLQEPRLFSQHFTDQLERRGAIEWNQGWVATELGRQALEDLADVGGIEDVKAELLPEPDYDEAMFA